MALLRPILFFLTLLSILAPAFASDNSLDQQIKSGQLANDEGRYTDAISISKELIRNQSITDLQLFSALRSKGSAHLRLGEYAKATGSFTSALQLFPDDVWSLWQRCWASAQLGRLTFARIDCESADRLVNFRGSLGSVSAETVSEIDIFAVTLAKSELHKLSGRPEVALEVLKGILPLKSVKNSRLTFLEKSAELYRITGDANSAIKNYSELLNVYKKNSNNIKELSILELRGDTYFQNSNYDLALVDFNAILEVRKEGDILYRVCSLWLLKEQFTKALDSCQQALDMEPNNVFVLDAYAVSLLALGDKEGAIKTYEKVLEINPDDRFTKSRLSKILANKNE